MTKKELQDISLDFGTFLNMAYEGDDSDSADVASSAVSMVKSMLERYPKLRWEMYENGEADTLDKLGLDYGLPW